VEVFQSLKALLHERGLPTAVGDEGGFAPDFAASEDAIRAVFEAAERAGHRDRIAIALDPAATEIWRDGAYRFEGRVASPDELIDYWEGLCGRYPSCPSRMAWPRTNGPRGGS
jgi:enolase